MSIFPNSDICETSVMSTNLTKQTDFDAIIIGGGACGLMCAVQAGFLGKRSIGTGKGRPRWRQDPDQRRRAL
jgi:predicted Rossmann-fold nucleotide-binding protein